MAESQPGMSMGAEGNAPLSSSAMQASLTTAKESRKRAELDAQLLANRIALLKQEEEKAWKKIEETRKRATEITELRKQNESKFAAKEQFYKDKWESIRTTQTLNAQKREQTKATREAVKDGLAQSRLQNAGQQKEQSKQVLLAKQERELQEREANIARSNYIRQRKEEGKRRLEEERLAQLEKYREDYESRAAQEELLRARTDALVAKMEQEEMELIQRLQNTQTVQRNAYEELEGALGTTAQQISSGAARGQAVQGKLGGGPVPRAAA